MDVRVGRVLARQLRRRAGGPATGARRRPRRVRGRGPRGVVGDGPSLLPAPRATAARRQGAGRRVAGRPGGGSPNAPGCARGRPRRTLHVGRQRRPRHEPARPRRRTGRGRRLTQSAGRGLIFVYLIVCFILIITFVCLHFITVIIIAALFAYVMVFVVTSIVKSSDVSVSCQLPPSLCVVRSHCPVTGVTVNCPKDPRYGVITSYVWCFLSCECLCVFALIAFVLVCVHVYVHACTSCAITGHCCIRRYPLPYPLVMQLKG